MTTNGPESENSAERLKESKSDYFRKASESITRMVIWVSFLFWSGALLSSIARSVAIYSNSYPSAYLMAIAITYVFIFTAKSSSIFVYFSFDRQYQNVLKDLLKKIGK